MNYMRRALSLARQALGHSSPNPAVGAVIVKDGVIVGEGYTQPPGSHHAEIMALQQAKESAQGAILYVTLEPCCYHGRTPPCTKAIKAAGIAEVHLATLDPNTLVCGKGQAELEAAGIKTVIGSLEAEAIEINEAYIKHITTQLPFVTIKTTLTLDGSSIKETDVSKLLKEVGFQQWFQYLHSTTDAILIGTDGIAAGTINGHKCVTRDAFQLVSSTSNVSAITNQDKIILAMRQPRGDEKAASLIRSNNNITELPLVNGKMDFKKLLVELGKQGIISIVVESGSNSLHTIWQQGLVDKVIVMVVPAVLGQHSRTCELSGVINGSIDIQMLRKVKTHKFGENILISGYLRGNS